jgi:hypothetical protein
MNQYTSYGITDAANSIPRLYETEMKHSLRHQVIKNKVVQLAPMSITSNADWWVSQWGENYTVVANTWAFVKPSGATCILIFNEDGSLKEASVFAPALFNMFKARFGDVDAAKLASTTYVFEQKVDSLTSILAGLEFDFEDGNITNITNNSLLNGVEWNESIYLGSKHSIIWAVMNRNNDTGSTELKIEAKSIPNTDLYTVTVRPQRFEGDPLPIPMMFENQSNDVANFLNIAEDDSIEAAWYDNETNTVYFNPNLDKCNVRMEIWPTDHNGKTENDHGLQYDLRTGELLPLQF